MSDKYTPGYVDVPGKGRRYRNAQGEYFDNHFGSVFNSFGNAFRGIGDAYNSYYDGVADAAGTERRDGTVAKPQKTPPTPQAPISSSGNVTRIGNKEYDLSDPTQKAAYDKVIAADLATRSGQKFADLRGGGGLKPDGSGRNAEPPTPNPNGVAQTGTSMGISSLSMEDAQTYVGKDVQIKNPFLSNALPGTNDDGYSYEDDRVMGASKAEAATRAGGGEVQVNIDGSGVVETKMVQGSPNLVLSGTESAAPSDVKTNDINDSSTWDENYARRRAFLDADSSMAGLKAVQAQKGIVYAGDKYYMNTGKTDDKGNPILNALEGKDAKQDVRGYMRGAQGAEDLKNKYIDKIQASEQSLTSPAPENYISTEQSPIAPIDSTAQVDASQITDAPTLIDEVKPEFTDKDKTGRYNNFR